MRSMSRVRGLLALTMVLAGCHAASSTLDGGGDGGEDAGTGPVWVPEPGIPVQADFFGVWGRGRNDIFIVGWGGTILHYDGMSWMQQTTTATVPLTAIHGWAPGDPAQNGAIFAVGWRGTILSYMNGAWVDQTKTTTNTSDLFGVRVASKTNALAVGDQGRIVAWDTAMGWKIRHLKVPGDFSGNLIEPLGVLKGVWSAGDRYYISGSGGAAYRSSGYISSFELLDTRVNDALRGIWGPNDSTIYAVGLDALILRFQNGEWRRITNNGADMLPHQFFFDVTGTAGDDITIVGWNGTIVRFLGGQWMTEVSNTTKDLRAVWIDPVTLVAFAVGADGTVVRRDPPPPPDASVDP
jgi:hypothetical protein